MNSKKPTRELGYIDIIRAIACLGVFIEHFSASFNMGFLVKTRQLTGNTIFSFLNDGRLAINMFLVISGFLIGYHSLKGRDINYKKLQFRFYKRFFHLFIPCAVVCILTYVLMRYGGMYNKVAYEYGANEYIKGIYYIQPTLTSLVECLKNIFGGGVTSYAPQLWTMGYEIIGGSICFIILMATGEKALLRVTLYLVGIYYCIFVIKSNYYEALFCGMLVSELCVFLERNKLNMYLRSNILELFLMLICFQLSTYMYFTIRNVYLVPVFSALGLGIGYFAFKDKVLTNKFARFIRYFGERTYGFYILHFLVIATFSSLFFIGFKKINISLYIGFPLNFLVTLLMVICLSELMHRYVILALGRIAEYLYNKIK